jgi:hypothetical protein
MSFCYPEGNFGRNQLLAFTPKIVKDLPIAPDRLFSMIEVTRPTLHLLDRFRGRIDYILSLLKETHCHLVCELHP